MKIQTAQKIFHIFIVLILGIFLYFSFFRSTAFGTCSCTGRVSCVDASNNLVFGTCLDDPEFGGGTTCRPSNEQTAVCPVGYSYDSDTCNTTCYPPANPSPTPTQPVPPPGSGTCWCGSTSLNCLERSISECYSLFGGCGCPTTGGGGAQYYFSSNVVRSGNHSLVYSPPDVYSECTGAECSLHSEARTSTSGSSYFAHRGRGAATETLTVVLQSYPYGANVTWEKFRAPCSSNPNASELPSLSKYTAIESGSGNEITFSGMTCDWEFHVRFYIQGCGDGVVDSGEQCDDGNTNNLDDCSNSCTINYCPEPLSLSCGANDSVVVNWSLDPTTTGYSLGDELDQTYIIRLDQDPTSNSQCWSPSYTGCDASLRYCWDGTQVSSCRGGPVGTVAGNPPSCTIGWYCGLPQGGGGTTLYIPGITDFDGINDNANDLWIGYIEPPYNNSHYTPGVPPGTPNRIYYNVNAVTGTYGGSIQVFGSNKVCDAGAERTGEVNFTTTVSCGCTYTSPPNAPTISEDESNSIDNGSTKMSPNINSYLRWDHDGNFGDSGTSCSPGRYRLNLYEGNCTTGTLVSSFPRTINEGSPLEVQVNNNLNFNTDYCWNVEALDAQNHSNRSSNYTFSTDKSPEFIRAGVQLVEDTTNPPVNGSATPAVGTPTCTTAVSNASCNTNPSNSGNLGGSTCWTGVESGNNTVYFWMEYDDPDNDPNEYRIHSFALTQNEYTTPAQLVKNVLLGNSYASHTGSLILNHPTDYYLEIENNESRGYRLGVRQFIDPTTNNLRISYRLEITNDNFPTGNFYIYGLLENIPNPPFGSDLTLMGDSYTEIGSTFTNRFTQIGEWSFDTNAPTAAIDTPVINGFNSFSVPWIVGDGVNGSGVASATAYCRSTNPGYSFSMDLTNFTDINGTVYNPNAIGLPESLTLDNSLVDCFVGNPTIQNHFETDGYALTEYTLNDPLDYGDLGLRIDDIQDVACNIGLPVIEEPNIEDPWIGTYQGTAFAEESIEKPIPADLSQEPTYYTGSDYLFYEISEDYLNMSSNIISTHSNIISGSSLTNQELPHYSDINLDPSHLTGNYSDWYSYLYNLAELNGKTIVNVTRHNELIIPDGSSLGTELKCDENSNDCYPSVPNLILEGTTYCDKQIGIFVSETLTINGQIISNSGDSGCVIVVGGNISISTESRIKDSDYNYDTSPYDQIDAFIIGGNQIRIDEDTDYANGYSDGLLINGALIAENDVINLRNLGLRNNIQPSLLINYSPSVVYLDGFQQAFSRGNTFELKEK